MKTLPDDVQAFRRTPDFTVDTVPAGLLRDHRTKAGVWGLITVTSGQVTYRIKDEAEPYLLSPGQPGVVEPEVFHCVELSEDAVFHVAFWK